MERPLSQLHPAFFEIWSMCCNLVSDVFAGVYPEFDVTNA